MKTEKEIREIFERELGEREAFAKFENVEIFNELVGLRKEILGDVLTTDGWIMKKEGRRIEG